MRKILIFITILCSGFFKSQTQLELNEMAEKKYQKTWKELTLLQDKLLQKYKNQKDKSNSIILSHKKWMKKRESHMKNINREGSFFPVRWYNELNYLTKERIKSINKTCMSSN